MASKMITHNDTKSLLPDLKGYNTREDVARLTIRVPTFFLPPSPVKVLTNID